MLADPLLILQEEAWRTGRPVPGYSHARVTLEPAALLITTIQLAGEDVGLHAVAVGSRAAARPAVLAVPDPRERDQHDALLVALGRILEAEMAAAEQQGRAPQLVVPDRATLEHLTTIADAYRFGRNPAIARAAALLSYFTDRAPMPGQQATVVLTELRCTHWIYPAHPAHQAALPVLDALDRLRPGEDPVAIAMAALASPLGRRLPRPWEDENLLRPHRAHSDALRRRLAHERRLAALGGEAPSALTQRLEDLVATAAAAAARAGAQVMAALTPLVTEHWTLAAEVAARADREDRPPLPIVPDCQREEQRTFAWFRRHIAAGGFLPRTDRTRPAASRLATREAWQAMVEASVAAEDRLGRVEALARSTRIRARLVDATRRLVDGRRRTVVTLEAEIPVSRLRPGDELATTTPGLHGTVQRVAEARGRLRLRLMLHEGARRAPGLVGQVVELVRQRPNAELLRRRLATQRDKLRQPHWTSGEVAAPPARPVALPAGIATGPGAWTRAVEAL